MVRTRQETYGGTISCYGVLVLFVLFVIFGVHSSSKYGSKGLLWSFPMQCILQCFTTFLVRCVFTSFPRLESIHTSAICHSLIALWNVPTQCLSSSTPSMNDFLRLEDDHMRHDLVTFRHMVLLEKDSRIQTETIWWVLQLVSTRRDRP